MPEEYVCFTKQDLIDANAKAITRDYNRVIGDAIADLSDDEVYPVMFSMVHEHASGVKVEPHMRCLVSLGPTHGGAPVMLDCPMEIFTNLKRYSLKLKPKPKPRSKPEPKVFNIGDRVKYVPDASGWSGIGCSNGVVVYHRGKHSKNEPRVRWDTGWGVSVPASSLQLLSAEEMKALPFPELIPGDIE